MTNLSPQDVDTRLTETREEFSAEHDRLWNSLDDERISRIAGDETNAQSLQQNVDALLSNESRLSTEVVQREEGDLRNIKSLTELAKALSDYRIKTDLEINNEKIAREQLGIDLNTRVDNFISTFDHKFLLVYQTIEDLRTETRSSLTLFDERIKKYEEMLQDITTDSIQITMDNGEINMGAWTILSQARQWDLEILGKFKDYQTSTNKDIEDALKDIQDKLPIEQDIIDKAIEALSNAPIIKDLDAKIDGAIGDIDDLHKELINEVTNRQNEMIDFAQRTADEMAANQQELVAKVEAETAARVDALQRESAIRQQEIINEAAERTAEIEERIKDIEGGVTTDLTEAYRRIDEVNEKAENYKADSDRKLQELNDEADQIHSDILAERDARIAAIKKLDDGLTQEIAYRKEGDNASMLAIDNYKASNDLALANVRDELAINVTATTANATAIRALDTQLTIVGDEATAAKNLAASATQKAETALSETSALASQMTTVNASIDGIKNDLVDKADAAAFNQLKAQVTDIDGVVQTTASDMTALKTQVSNIDNTVSGQTSAITELKSTQVAHGDNLTQLNNSTTALRSELDVVKEDMTQKVGVTAFNELKTEVNKQGDNITVISQDVTTLSAKLDTVTADVATKAEASAVSALQSKVETIDGKVVANSESILKLNGQVSTIEEDLDKKLDATVIQSYYTKVETDQAVAGGIAKYDTSLYIGGQNLWSVVENAFTNAYGTSVRTVVNADEEHFKMSLNAFHPTANVCQALIQNALVDQSYQFKQGEDFVVSFEVRASRNAIASALYFYFGGIGTNLALNQDITTEWVRLVFPLKASGTAVNGSYQMFGYNLATTRGWAAGDWIEFRHVQMQRGTKATEYTKSSAKVQNLVKANATAIEQTNTTVSNLDGVVKANSNKITELTASVNKNTQDIATKASAQAVTDLATRVTATENSVTSISTDVTKLNNDVSQLQTDISKTATSAALQALDSRVETAEGKITSQQSAITSLQGQVAVNTTEISKKASAQALQAVDQRVTVTEETIESQSTAITNLNNELDVTQGDLLNADLIAKLSSQGKVLRTDPTFKTGSNLTPYVSQPGSSYARRAASADNPTGSTHEYLIRSTSVLGSGWLPQTPYISGGPNKIFFIKQIIKMPVGLRLQPYNNPLGTGGYIKVLSNPEGTGKFDIYYSIVYMGPDAGTTIQGHFRPLASSVNTPPVPSAANPVDVIVASYEAWDVTAISDGIPKEWADKVEATASAQTALDSKVTAIDGRVASNSSQLTNLNNRVTITERDLQNKAESSAVATLASTVEQQGNKITSNSSDISTLKNNVSTLQGQVATKAEASSVATLTNRVEKNEKDIKTNSDSMVSLNNTISTSVNALSINSSVEGMVYQITAGKVSKVPDPTVTAGQVMVLGENSPAGSVSNKDTVWGHAPQFLAVDPKRIYRLRARYRRVSGNGGVYLGVAALNVTKTKYITTTGTEAVDMNSSNYVLSNARPALGVWQEVEYFITGISTGSASGNGTLANPRNIQKGAAFITPMLIANYGALGQTEFDYVTLEYADEYQLIDAQANATSLLSTEISKVDGKVNTLTTDVTRMGTRVDDLDGQVKTKAESSALNSLTTRVENTEKGLETGAANVLKLTADLNYLSVGGTNILKDSERERETDRTVQREYFLYEASPELKAFYNQAMATPDGLVTISFDVKATVAGSFSVYSSNGSFHTFSANVVVAEPNVWQHVVVTVKPGLHGTNTSSLNSTLEFYGTYGTNRVLTIRRAKMELGAIATPWTISPRDGMAGFDVHTQAISTAQANIKKNTDGVTALNNEVTTLETRLTANEGKTAVNTNAISGLETRVSATESTVNAQATDITRIGVRVDSNAGPGLAQDFNLVDEDSWHNHYNMNSNPSNIKAWFNVAVADAPVGPRCFYVPAGQSSIFMYNKTPLAPKKYRVQFWAKRSAEATGAGYVTIARMKAGEAPNVSAYTYLNLSDADIPRNGTWTLVDKIVSLDTLTANGLYTNFRVGFSVNNGTGPGECWVQGFKVTEVIDVKDTTGVASADAMTALTTRVQTAEGKIDTQAGQITQLNTAISGKADSGAVTSLASRVTNVENQVTTISEQTTSLTGRVDAQDGKILANTGALNTLTTKVSDVEGAVSSQATQLTKLESTLDTQVVGGTNLQPGTQLASSYVQYNNAVLTKVAGSFKTEVVRATKVATTVAGIQAAAAFRKVVLRPGIDYILTAKVRGTALVDYVYLMNAVGANTNLAAYDRKFSAPFNDTNFVTLTAKFRGTTIGFKSDAFVMISSSSGAANSWFEVAEVMLQEGNTGTVWSPSYLDIPEVDLSEYAKASAVSSLQTKVNEVDGKVTSQATQISQLQSDLGTNSAKLNTTAEVVDGMKAGYYVKTDVNGLVAGFGVYNDGVGSVFGVNADMFYIGKGSGGKKPFIVTTTPQTIDGVTYPVGTWISVALIANATIGTAHIADAAITNAKIANLDASKITTGVLDAQRVRVGPTSSFDAGYNPKTNLDAAKDYNDITVIPGNGGKIFHTPAVYREPINNNNPIVIKTPIVMNNQMTLLKLIGYNYTAGVGAAFTIDISFYAYAIGPTFYNNRARINGIDISSVTLGLDGDGKVVVILQKASNWSYPQITLESATLTAAIPPDSYKNGFSIVRELDVSGYTNRTVVPNIDNIETEAGSQAKANVVNAKVVEFSTDNILSSPEKKQVKTMWDEIAKEYPTYTVNAGSVSVSTAAYKSAYDVLNAYLTPLLSNLNANSTIVRGTFQTNFANYYDERTKLIKAINDGIKAIGDTAQNVANSKARTYITQPTTPYSVGDLWKSGNTTMTCIVARASGAFVAADWTKIGDVTAENTAADTAKLGGVAASTVNQNISNADSKATTAQSAAATADGKAVTAQTMASNADTKAGNAATAASNADAKATTAQSLAATADGKATNAAADAAAANNQVNAWKFTGTTEIDGGKIRADTITAVQMNVQELSTISANLGTMITYADPSQPTKARMVIQGTAIKVYDDNNIERIFIGL